VKITRDVMRMARQGKSPEEMREAIHEKYGFLGKGTETPGPK